MVFKGTSGGTSTAVIPDGSVVTVYFIDYENGNKLGFIHDNAWDDRRVLIWRNASETTTCETRQIDTKIER